MRVQTWPARVACAIGVGIVLVWAASAQSLGAQSGSVAPVAVRGSSNTASEPNDASRALLNRYCVTCHNQKLKTGGMVLEGADLDHIAQNGELWERVLRKLRTGEMPPPGLPRPSPEASASLANRLEETLDKAATLHPNPGRPAIHRLNRTEYTNAIRDLLALDTKPGAMLPVDDSGYGFDNIADLLSVSPALLERYISAARKVSRLAIGDLSAKPTEEVFRPLRDPNERTKGARNERASDDLPFGSRGGMALKHYFPLDAEYSLKTLIALNPQPEEMALPKPDEIRVTLKAGMHTIGVDFPRDSSKPEVEPVLGRRPPVSGVTNQLIPMEIRVDGQRVKILQVTKGGVSTQLNTLTVGGPFNPTGRGETPSRAKIFTCRPVNGQDEEKCARTILAQLARRAFRRPVTDSDLRPLLAFYQTGRTKGDFDDGIQNALQAMLVSPDFLFRIEQDQKGVAAGTAYRLSDLELASRLSFFLWSSIPDETLLTLAENGKLKDPAILEQQARRMLQDKRSDSLVTTFAGQWLYLRNIANQRPDPEAFPNFDEHLRVAMQRETELFFESILREDRSVLDLLDAKYTFLNQQLAEHYGIRNVYGSQFRRVELTDPHRTGGLLGQASILMLTSYPNRTSVVQRGKWVLDNLLGSPPPPPPPDVPELKPTGSDGKQLTMRQAMEQHRANAICASCHARMDPIGFALENYDGIGHWRNTDAGSQIDATGKLPDGTQFSGLDGLSKLLATKYRDDFVAAATQKLMTYALGRGLEYYDKPVVRSIMREAGKDDYRMSSMILAIVKSTPFQMRRSSQP